MLFFVCLTVPVRSYHCQSSTAVCRCCLAVTGNDDQKQFIQRNRRRNALDGYLLKVVSDSRWLIKMTVETVYSRKVTLKEDVLSSYQKGYGMRVLEEHQRTRSSTHTVAEDSARQGLRQTASSGGRAAWKRRAVWGGHATVKTSWWGKSIAPVRRSNRGVRRRLGRRGREGSGPLCSQGNEHFEGRLS